MLLLVSLIFFHPMVLHFFTIKGGSICPASGSRATVTKKKSAYQIKQATLEAIPPCPNESSVLKSAVEKVAVPKSSRRVALMTGQSGAKVKRRG